MAQWKKANADSVSGTHRTAHNHPQFKGIKCLLLAFVCTASTQCIDKQAGTTPIIPALERQVEHCEFKARTSVSEREKKTHFPLKEIYSQVI